MMILMIAVRGRTGTPGNCHGPSRTSRSIKGIKRACTDGLFHVSFSFQMGTNIPKIHLHLGERGFRSFRSGVSRCHCSMLKSEAIVGLRKC